MESKLSDNWLKFLETARFTRGKIVGDTVVYPTGIVIDLTSLSSDPSPKTHRKLIQRAYVRVYMKTPAWAKYQGEYQKKRIRERQSIARNTKHVSGRPKFDSSYAISTIQSLQVPAFVRAFDRIVSGEAVLS